MNDNPRTSLASNPQTFDPNVMETYRCFHCKDVFAGIDARNHFGTNETREPACQIKAAGEFALLQALRNAEDELARYRSEDSDVLRAMASMQSDHATALRREEEKGFARGVKDATEQFGQIRDALQTLVDEILESGTRAFELDVALEVLKGKRLPSETTAPQPIDRQKLRNAISGTFVEDSGPTKVDDNLAIALCTYFDDHPECPEDERISDDHGWKPWVVDKCNAALDAITDAAIAVMNGERRLAEKASGEPKP